MPRHSLAVLHLYVHPRGDTKDRKVVDDFDSSGSDLLPLFHKFVTSLPDDALVDSERERYVSVQDLDPAGRRLMVTVESGYTGIPGRVKNTKTHTVEHAHGTDSSHTTETRMLLCAPKASKAALLFIEKVGNANPAAALVELFIAALKHKHPDLMFKAEWVLEADAWLATAELEAVYGTVQGYGWSTDEADADIPKVHGELRLELVPESGKSYLPKKIWTSIKGNRGLAGQMLGVSDDMELSDLSVTVRSDGKSKTFAIDKERQPRLTLLLSDRGQPVKTDAEFKAFCYSQAEDLLPSFMSNWNAADQSGTWPADYFNVTLDMPPEEE